MPTLPTARTAALVTQLVFAVHVDCRRIVIPRAPCCVCLSTESKLDPFRPARPPLEPMVINAIQDMLSGQNAGAVAANALQARRADPDYTLTADEEALLTRWVAQCAAASDALEALLVAAVAATPWVSQFGATASFGVGEATDPYVRASRAECMLASLILHVDGGDVNFIEEDRLEVLQDAPPREAIEAVRAAAATAT